MAAGCPVVNTALETAVPRIARHEQEGLTVPPRDPDALASALTRLLDDQSLAKQLGDAAAARARSVYNQTVFIDQMDRIYESCVTSREQSPLDSRDAVAVKSLASSTAP
jgi:rhamnosyl/mannosyltransferase